MKRKFISILLASVMVMTLFSSVCTVASAVTVRDLSSEGFVESSATPQELGRWDGYTGTVTDGANNSRIIAYSGSSTGSHISLSIPQSAVNTNSSAKPYILHLSYRIQNDRTNPAFITHTMRYLDSSKGKTKYNDLFVANTSQFTMNLDTTKNITSFGTSNYNYLDAYDYKVDLYENLKTGAYQIYLNGVKWISAYDYTSGAYTTLFSASGNGAYTIHEYRIRVTGAANSSWAFKLVNPCYEIYNQDVLMDDIIAATASGYSNYLNATGPSETANKTINSVSNLTLSPSAGTSSSSYSATGVSSGAQLIWWSGSNGTFGDNKPMFGSYTVSGKEWYHMGFDITGTVGLKLNAQVTRTDGTNGGDWTIVAERTVTDQRVDYIFDLKNSWVHVYYGKKYYNGGAVNVRQLKQLKLTTTTAANFTISNIVHEYYGIANTPGDILAGYDSRTKTTYDYIYNISGLNLTATNAITKMDGICSVTGDNSSGYTLAPNSINQTNGGFARMRLNYVDGEYGTIFQSTDDKVLVYTAKYTPSVVSSGSKHQFGIRGNDGYYWFLTAQNGNFYTEGGDLIKSYSTSGTYTITFIINNKDYKYYCLLDGVCFDSGTLYSARQPLWQIVYTMWNTSDRIILKDVQTTLYKSNYTTLDKVKPLLTRIYANLESCTVSDSTASVTTSYIANTSNSAGSNTNVIYGVYNSAGALLKYQAVNSANTYVNGSNLTTSVTIPSGGTTLKVFMWNMNLGSSVLTPIANQITKSLQ